MIVMVVMMVVVMMVMTRSVGRQRVFVTAGA